MTDDDDSQSPAAKRQRLYRERKRDGIVDYRLRLPEDLARIALIEIGALSRRQLGDKAATEAALQRFMNGIVKKFAARDVTSNAEILRDAEFGAKLQAEMAARNHKE